MREYALFTVRSVTQKSHFPYVCCNASCVLSSLPKTKYARLLNGIMRGPTLPIIICGLSCVYKARLTLLRAKTIVKCKVCGSFILGPFYICKENNDSKHLLHCVRYLCIRLCLKMSAPWQKKDIIRLGAPALAPFLRSNLTDSDHPFYQPIFQSKFRKSL